MAASPNIRVAPRIIATLLFFAAIEGAIFHTRVYPSIVKPDSTTGSVELRIHAEERRPKAGQQVLVVGNSRMSFLRRLVNGGPEAGGYEFGSVAAPGTYPRSWYYLLRAADPTARAYAAIVIQSDDYDEYDGSFVLEDAPWDLHYMLARLELRDLFEFALSHRDPQRRIDAFRGILLKGFVYKRDFQELLRDPAARWASARQADQYWAQWAYEYVGAADSMAGLEIDWQSRTARFPPQFTADQRRLVQELMLAAPPADTGEYSAYYRYWYGRILDHYRGSPAKIVFVRLPRGPIPRPQRPPRANSAVRQLAAESRIILLPEHLLDALERPELFVDPLHLNQPGMEKFAPMLAAGVRAALGPPTQ